MLVEHRHDRVCLQHDVILSKDFLHLLNAKLYCYFHKGFPSTTELSPLKSVNIFQPYFLKIHFNIILNILQLRFLLGLSNKIL